MATLTTPEDYVAQKFMTDEIKAKLLENGKASASAIGRDGNTPDHVPVVKYFTPDGACTWLLTELDPEDPDIAFGLCDLGMGFPELGTVRISELQSVRGKMGLPVERDTGFKADKPLSAYAEAANKAQSIQA